MVTSREEVAAKAVETVGETAIGATTAGLAAAAAGAAVAGAAVVGGGLVLLPTVASGILGLAFSAHRRKVQKKVDRWFELVAAQMEVGTVEAVAEEIREHIDESWAHEAVIEATKRILEDIGEAALPFLARLTAHSLKTRSAPDDRNKHAAELLVRCHDSLVEPLRAFVCGCHDSWPINAPGIQAMALREADGKVVHALEAATRNQVGTVSVVLKTYSPPSEKRIPATEEIFDLFALLKVTGFAADNPSGFLDVQAGPHVAKFQRSDVEFLYGLLK